MPDAPGLVEAQVPVPGAELSDGVLDRGRTTNRLKAVDDDGPGRLLDHRAGVPVCEEREGGGPGVGVRLAHRQRRAQRGTETVGSTGATGVAVAAGGSDYVIVKVVG